MDLLQDEGMTWDDIEVAVNSGAFVDGCSHTWSLQRQGEEGREAMSKCGSMRLRGSYSGMARHGFFSS